jgi:hypothetical protein
MPEGIGYLDKKISLPVIGAISLPVIAIGGIILYFVFKRPKRITTTKDF